MTFDNSIDSLVAKCCSGDGSSVEFFFDGRDLEIDIFPGEASEQEGTNLYILLDLVELTHGLLISEEDELRLLLKLMERARKSVAAIELMARIQVGLDHIESLPDLS